MEIVYTHEEMPETLTKSIFLAGPSLRPGQEEEMVSWRKAALEYLEKQGFDGVVFVPENRDGKFEKNFSYDNQIEWEEKHLNVADCIVFWVPRDLEKLPAFTTNIEWGTWASSGKVVFGAPKDAEKVSYLQFYAKKYKVPMSDSLEETLDNAMEMVGEGAERTTGERFVPLLVWKQHSFENWYKAQKRAGNHIDTAQLLWTFRPQFKNFLFCWILQVNLYVAAEDRVKKSGEFVLARTDISSVCMYHHKADGRFIDTEIVLVKEFRPTAATKDAFIRELPGGSSNKPEEEPEEVAAHEVHEETGFYLDSSRLRSHGALQLAATLSAHKAHLYSAELTDEEVEWFKSQDGIVHGNIKETEMTYIEVKPLYEILNEQLVDWTTLGMILTALKPDLY